MNRTAILRLLPVLAAAAALLAQDSQPQGDTRPKAGVMDGVVRKLREAESKATRVRLQLLTEGTLPGGLEFHTKGTLRVLRSEQGALLAAHALIDCTFADGIQSHMESVKNPSGLWTFETNPAFPEVYLHYDKDLVADLEWAGEVLGRTDLPGAGDARAMAPLGSEMLADLAQRFDLQELGGKTGGQLGTWYGGDRRPGGSQEDDADLPLADRVELFLRSPDSALLEIVYLQAGKPIQRIKVEELVVGEAMPLESFVLDTKGRKPKDVRGHDPEWDQIQQLLQGAREKAEKLPEAMRLPPSERKKDEPKKDEAKKEEPKKDGK
jgi:hypothetical protein